MKQKILDLLQDYFVDESLVAEITAVLDTGVGNAVSLLETRQISQQEISDWAVLHGYVCIKVDSFATRLKIEKLVQEIWGDGSDDHLIGGYEL